MSKKDVETIVMELQRTTAMSRLTLGEGRTVLAKLIELGWQAPKAAS